jgi:putative transposase
VDPAQFLLPVSRYVESNPVRHGLVKKPGDYAWSSYGANALGNDDPLVKPHPAYEKLGRSHKARQTAYAKGFATPPDEALLTRIREATNKAWVLGDSAFCQEVEQQLNRRTSPRPRGGDRRSVAYRRATGRL